ncbi:MAG: VCBS repeat-containing protein, partial [Candidatus Zixiibacteriota bacterium]
MKNLSTQHCQFSAGLNRRGADGYPPCPSPSFPRRVVFLLLLVLAFGFGGGVSAGELPRLLATIRGDSTFDIFGINIEGVGDQNGDGYDDVAIMDHSKSGHNPKLRIYYGGPNGVSAVSEPLTFALTPVSTVGDVNGDGFVDFTFLRNVPLEPLKMELYYGGFPLDTVRDGWFGWDSLPAEGRVVRGYDLNRNGTDELIAAGFDQRSVFLFELDGSKDTLPD